MSKPSRIKPPLSEDNAWWWEQASQDKLVIQRCMACQALRHPPRPMCEKCRSMEWDFIESKGKGTVTSHTTLHHPQFPGYEYPLIMGLIDLEEGTRIVAQISHCKPEELEFGMPVTVLIHEDEDGFKLPVFEPAKPNNAVEGVQ